MSFISDMHVLRRCRATMTSKARDMSSRAAMLAASHAAADTAAKWDSSTRAGES